MNSILTIVTFFPLLGVAAILLLKSFNQESDDRIRQVALTTSIATFVISVIVLVLFDRNVATLQSEHVKGELRDCHEACGGLHPHEYRQAGRQPRSPAS